MTNGKLVEHHIKYKEIHGYDETVWMTQGNHQKLHNRLRKEGKCNVSVDELHKIAKAAHNRTEKAKTYNKVFWAKYRKQERSISYQKEYQKNYRKNKNYKDNLQQIAFSESQEVNTSLSETISYNHMAGTVSYWSGFRCEKGYVLPKIYI